MLEIRHEHMDSTSNTQQAYNQIYEDAGILHHDSLYLWLIGLLNPQPGRVLVDISTGQGRLVTLAQRTGLHGIGTDFAASGLYLGKAESPQSGWVVGDGEGLPFADGCADYITHIGSLEHYINPLKGAQEVARMLKKDGKACILLPNAYGLWGNIKHVWLKGEIFDDGQPLQRYATRTTWENLLKQAGLKIDRTIGYGEIDWPRTAKDLGFLLLRPQKIIRGLLSLLIPKNLANHFVFIASRDS